MFEPIIRRSTGLAALAAAALALAACGGEPAQQAYEPTAQPTATAQPTVAEATPQQPAAEQKSDSAAVPQTVRVRDLALVKADAPVSEQQAVLSKLNVALGEQDEPAAAGDQATPEATAAETRPAEAPAGAAEPVSAYRAIYRLELQQGNNAAEPLEYITEVDGEGRARYQSSFVNDNGQKITVFVYTVDQTSYTTASDNENFCIALAEDKPAGVPQPRDWLNDIESAELAEQGVEVNGFLTDRYTFRDRIETQEVQAEISGEVWVARGLNIIIRHRGESVGRMMAAPDSNTMEDARVSWEYSFERIASDFEVEIPAACLEGGDLPVPPGAKNSMRAGGMTSFDIDSPVNEVAAFYKEEMQKAGWTLAEESAYGDTVTLSFEKGDQKVSAQISKDEQITRVILILE